ncbi:MAG: hypothetical protein ACOCX0_03595 [Bacteroidota bacterium]
MHNFFSLVFLMFSSATINDQLSIPVTLPGFLSDALKTVEVPVEAMRPVDMTRLLQEDQVFDMIRDIPWRFGDNINVQINPRNSGRWDYLESGARMWRIW